MALFTLAPLLVLLLGAITIWALNTRVRTFPLGLIALGSCGLALGLVVGAQAMPQFGGELALLWTTLNGQPIELRLGTTGLAGLTGAILLLAGAITAGGLTWTLGRATHAFGLVLAGLLVQLLGGVLTISSATLPGVLVGLGGAWLGSTIMQQATTAHNREAIFGGLPVLVLALTLLTLGAAPQLGGGAIAASLWLLGCTVLIALAPQWSTTPTAPLLVRAPTLALGLPTLGPYLLVRYATTTANTWSAQTTTIVLLVGTGSLILAAINALTALRLGHAFGWQLVAQFALIAIVFGTGRPEAAPMAAGLLIHTIVVSSGMALAIGLLERATRTEDFAALPPLPQPLRQAGLAYGLGAISSSGIPPLLGYTLRRVVLIVAGINRPWLPPIILAASTLLALSYLPTLVAFFRRPAFKSSVATVDQRGAKWPLALMLGLLLGGLVPDTVWQFVLGDTSVQPQAPTLDVWVRTGVIALLTLIVLGSVNRALRHPRPPAYFTGGEPLDEEPGWALPFVALRRVLRPLVVPAQRPGQVVTRWADARRERLTEVRQTLERRYYLAVVVASLIAVLLLAI